MRNFINKWWKSLLIGIMSILLVIAIIMIVDLKKDVSLLAKLVDERDRLLLDEYKKNEVIYEKNKMLVDSMEIILKQQKVVVITKNHHYETLKKSPLDYNITDSQLLILLKDFESKYKIR